MSARRWLAVVLLGLTTVPAPAEEKPAARLDLHGDALPDGAIARLGTVRFRAWGATCLTFSRDGKRVVAGYFDPVARLWDTATGSEAARFHGKQGYVAQVALSPDGGTLATLDVDRTLQFWDVRSGKLLRRAEVPIPVFLGT